MGIKESVDISITSATKTVSQAGFGVALVLSENANFFAQTQEFESAGEDLAAALCGGSDAPEYEAIQTLFSQAVPPESVKLGNVSGSKTITFDTGTYTAGKISLKANGVVVNPSYNSDKDTTLDDLATAIAAADTTNIASAVYTSGYRTLVVTPKTGKLVALTEIDLTAITGSMTAALAATRSAALDDTLDKIVLEDDDFYGVFEIGRVKGDQEDVAAWVEAYTGSPKIFALGSNETDIADTTDAADTTTIAAVLKANARRRSCGMYSTKAAPGATTPEYPDAGVFGNILPRLPGRWTLCYKTLAGCTADQLTPTQSTNVRAKYFNTYEVIGGVSIVRWGTTSSGEYLDYIVFMDWLKSRLSEAVFGLFVNSAKVSYDRDGFAAIQDAMTAVFKEGQVKDANGIQAITDYSEDSNKVQNGGYWIEFPRLEDIAAADKQNRLLQNVKFAVWYTNGIQTFKCTGAIIL